MPKDKTHITSLDSLRAFAALSVCLYHFVCKTTDYIQSEWLLTFFSGGKSGVQLFFVISGFVIPWSMYQAGYKQKDFFLFFLKRLTRLEPPYVFSIVLALIILYLREYILNRSNDYMLVSPQQIFLHFGYLIPFFEGYQWLNQVYWTLAIEFQYYFFIALLFVPLVKSNFIQRIIIYTTFIIMSFIDNNSFLPYWLMFFLIGILIFLIKAKLIKSKEYYLITFIVLVFSFIRYPFVSVLYAIIPVFIILYKAELKIPILQSIGKFSYSLYLIHPLVGASIINVLSHYFNTNIEKIAVICTGFVVTLVFSWLTYRYIELPSKRLSGYILYNKT